MGHCTELDELRVVTHSQNEVVPRRRWSAFQVFAAERMRVRYKFSEVTDSGCFLVPGNFVFCVLCETFAFSVSEPEDILEVSIAQPDRNARAKLKRAA